MAKPLTVTEFELYDFFAVEPVLLDPAEPWDYNDAAYLVSDGPLELSFAIAPAYKDIRMTLKLHGEIIYDFQASGVADVCYRQEKQRRLLEIMVFEGSTIWLRIQPRIQLTHHVTNNATNNPE